MQLARLVIIAVLITGTAASVFAQPSGSSGNVWEFPSDPQRWLNAPPLSIEALTGKGVILYFFEEECPRCQRFWPKLQALSDSYADKPVVFIAVNSGTAPGELQRYVRRQKVKWPLIQDVDRSFEAAFGVTPISLGGGLDSMSNVNHVIAISPKGNATNMSAQQLPAAVEQVLKGASWRVDPKDVPPPLAEAWRWIEIGAYPKAARQITRAAEHRDETLKAGAEALLEAVNKGVATDQKAVNLAKRKKDYWAAYKQLEVMKNKYEGYEAQEEITEQLEELGDSKTVAGELKARRSLTKAVRTASKGTDGAVRRAVAMLEKLVEKDPKTEAADTARDMLAKYETQR